MKMNGTDDPPMLTKLQSLSKKNKKILESISTHLINNPDEIESKLYEHRFLEQKYNQLIGFSRQNVDKYEKAQYQLALKDSQITRLKKQLVETRDNQRRREKQLQREYEARLAKKQQEIRHYQQELEKKQEKQSASEQSNIMLDRKIREQYEPQILKLRQEVEKLKTDIKRQASLARELEEKKKQKEGEIRVRQATIQELENQIKKLKQQNTNIAKKKNAEELDGLQQKINQVRGNLH